MELGETVASHPWKKETRIKQLFVLSTKHWVQTLIILGSAEDPFIVLSHILLFTQPAVEEEEIAP